MTFTIHFIFKKLMNFRYRDVNKNAARLRSSYSQSEIILRTRRVLLY